MRPARGTRFFTYTCEWVPTTLTRSEEQNQDPRYMSIVLFVQITMCEEATRGVDASSGSGTPGLGSGPILIVRFVGHFFSNPYIS